jgi:HEPN domain-containing protein
LLAWFRRKVLRSRLANTRERIFLHWEPDKWPVLPRERANASRLREELSRVAEAGAWRSTALLAGQLAEACLRSKLISIGVDRFTVRNLRRFRAVIRQARASGLLHGQVGSTNYNSLNSAIDLRNESSHFAFWRLYTSENEATWALVLASLILNDLGFTSSIGTDSGFRAWLEAEAKVLNPITSGPARPLTPLTLGSSFVASYQLAEKKSSYSVSHVRNAILTNWIPPTVNLGTDEQVGMAVLWGELKLVADRGAWRAVASLSGQLLESYLKSKLIQHGGPDRERVENMVLKPLIRRVNELNLFSRAQDRATTGADAVHSSEILRNWASHYAFWLPYTNELRATQALALLVTVLESLYPLPKPLFSAPPVPVDPAWMTFNWKMTAPGTILTFLERTPTPPPPFDKPPQDFFDHIVRNGALPTLGKLLHWVKANRLPSEQVRAAVHSCFPNLLRKAYRESLKTLMDVVFQLNGLFGARDPDEPAAHALIFGALLPMDVSSLKDVFSLPTARIPVYFALARRCGDNLLSQALRCDKRPCGREVCDSQRCRELIHAFWMAFDPSKNENALNMANTLLKMPDDVKADFLEGAPTNFLRTATERPLFEWLKQNLARNSVNLLGSFNKKVLQRDSSGRLKFLREEIVAAVLAAVENDRVQDLSMVPYRLYRMGLSDDLAAKSVLEAILSRTASQELKSEHTLRILWDTYQYHPLLTTAAVRAAEDILDREFVPTFDALCIAGVLELNSNGSCSARWDRLGWNEQELVEKSLSKSMFLWNKLLASLAVFRRAAAFPHSSVPEPLVRATSELIRNVDTGPCPPASLALVIELRRIFDALPPDPTAL